MKKFNQIKIDIKKQTRKNMALAVPPEHISLQNIMN